MNASTSNATLAQPAPLDGSTRLSAQALARNLEQLFPARRSAHLRLTGVRVLPTGESRKIVVSAGKCTGWEYYEHVRDRTRIPKRGLGVFLGYPAEPRGPGEPSGPPVPTRWLAGAAALDFDGVTEPAFSAFLDALAARGITPYSTSGTTGRVGAGRHVWVLFTEPAPQVRVFDALEGLADLAETAGLSRPELFPSAPDRKGNGIFLPYRGASRDGFGFNPLTDPLTGAAVPLTDAPSAVRRTPFAQLAALMPARSRK